MHYRIVLPLLLCVDMTHCPPLMGCCGWGFLHGEVEECLVRLPEMTCWGHVNWLVAAPKEELSDGTRAGNRGGALPTWIWRTIHIW